MNKLSIIAMSIIVLVIIDMILMNVFNFLAISATAYGNYLIWLNVIVLFMAILPTEVGTTFAL